MSIHDLSTQEGRNEYSEAISQPPKKVPAQATKRFLITYNHFVYKPSNYEIYKQQKDWSLKLQAIDLEDAKEKLKKDWNKNPAYFNFKEY